SFTSRRRRKRSELVIAGQHHADAEWGGTKKRQATRRSPTASQLPLLGSNQDSPDPLPLRLSPPLETLERSWSGLCLHLRRFAVRWLPPSLYTFPSQGLARRCQSRVRRLREHSRTSFPAWCPASAPSGAARVRRVASYTKGQYYSCQTSGKPGSGSFYLEARGWSIEDCVEGRTLEPNPDCNELSALQYVARVRVVCMSGREALRVGLSSWKWSWAR